MNGIGSHREIETRAGSVPGGDTTAQAVLSPDARAQDHDDTDSLLDLLERWDEQYRRGEDNPPESFGVTDPALLSAFEALIERQKKLYARLELVATAAAKPLGVDASPPAFPGYEVLSLIGRGGMGVVFTARDEKLGRIVALKTIAEGQHASSDQRARFQAEAEAVARLSHPNIITIHAIGEHGGRPYFSLEYAEGGSLADRLARGPMASRQAAAMVETLARAVHVAHQAGIVHRDLKPSNVLFMADGSPKVSDFGLAKLVGGDSGRTLSGQVMGSPSYMAPEQAEGHSKQVGPAADGYALGAILYQALTGRPPFLGESQLETLKLVTTTEVVPPRRLRPDVPRNLETICLKCLSKEPRNRYAGAEHLADDLRRFLEGRPIVARPVGPIERLWRWCRRNPWVAAFVAALVLGLIESTREAVRATVAERAAKTAEAATREQRDRAMRSESEVRKTLGFVDKANAELARSRASVQARYDLAVDAIRTFHTGVSEDFLLKQEPFKELRDRLLKSASDFYGKLVALLGRESDPVSRRALASANFEVAELTAKVGQLEDSLAAHRNALAVREALASEPGAGIEATTDIGRSLAAIGKLLESTGKTGEAMDAYRRAERLLAGLAGTDSAAALVPTRAVLAACRSQLGGLLYKIGRPADSLSILRQARADQEELAGAPGAKDPARNELATTIFRIGLILEETGKVRESETEFRAAVAIQRQLAKDNPAVTEYRALLANSLNNLAILLQTMGKASEAEAEYRSALAINQKLAEDNPAVASFRRSMADCHVNLGVLMGFTGKAPEAETEFRAALAIQQKLADDNPLVTSYRSVLALSHNNLGALLQLTGKSPEAEIELRAALAIQQKLADDNPTVPRFLFSLADTRYNLGELLASAGKSQEAEGQYRAALAIRQKLSDDNPGVTDFRSRLAYNHDSLGVLLSETGKAAQAEAEFREALAIRRKLADDNPAITDHRNDLAADLICMADLLRSLGRLAEARQDYDEAVTIRERLIKDHPTVTMFRNPLAPSLRRRGLVKRDLGDPIAAAADVRRALELYEGLPSRSGEEWFETACCRAALAGLAAQAGSGVLPGERQKQASKAMELLRTAVAIGYRKLASYRTDSALDSLRDRDDFRLLLMDLALPERPFAP
jgi:eukaryotic-like serine/threonine-protein kinase